MRLFFEKNVGIAILDYDALDLRVTRENTCKKGRVLTEMGGTIFRIVYSWDAFPLK